MKVRSESLFDVGLLHVLLFFFFNLTASIFLPYCTVSIEFIEGNVKYKTAGDACYQFHGAHGFFFDDQIHVKDGEVTLPTIKDFGFTDEDIAQFDKLIPGLVTKAQDFLDQAGGPDGAWQELESTDIKNAKVYYIETQNIYNGTSCDFSNPYGYCIFTVFMKDAEGHYWILGGNTYDLQGKNPKGFKYATSHSAWKKKIPAAFTAELERLEVGEDLVTYVK